MGLFRGSLHVGYYPPKDFDSKIFYYPTARLKPPKIAKSAKNIEIGRIDITVHAILFALVQAVLPSTFVVALGQSMACSTSEYMRMPMIRPTATPMNPIM